MADGVTTVLWKKGTHFCTEVEAGQLMCDESGLTGKAYPSSPELLMASLGSCTGSVLVAFADRHGLDLEGMKIELAWSVGEKPHRIGVIDISVNLPGKLTAKQRRTLERVAKACLIHNTLTHPPEITTRLSASLKRQ